jgi:ribosomal peptide maturation radical SAM protein 1
VRIALVNPPFTTVRMPSLALAQLKARLQQQLGARAQVEVHYLNHDMAAWLGIDLSEEVANNTDIYHTGFGDWLFRGTAFPDAPDNLDAYLKRHYRLDDQKRATVMRVLERRAEIPAFVDALIDKYRLHECALVGFTAVFSQTVAGIAFATRIKARNPQALVVMGGACCEGTMGREIAANVPAIDYVFSGSALVSMPRFIDAWQAGTLAQARIKGVFGKRQQPLATVDSCAPEVGDDANINEVIDPDYRDFLDSFESKVSHGRFTPVLLLETSRGCWWGEIQHCTFCGLNGSTMAFREMSPDKAREHFRVLFERYPRVTAFEAVDNILPHGYLKDVLPFLDTPAHATLFYEVKSNMDEEDVRVLARSRLRAFQPGIEALNTSTLKLMKKGVSAFQNLRFLGHCRVHGVTPRWSILIGFPGEPEEVYQKYLDDLPLLSHLPPPIDVGPVRFDRFSPYHVRAVEYGLDLHPFDYYRFVYPFGEQSLHNLAYHFVHRDPQFYVPVARWQKRIQAVIDAWQARWTGADGGLPAELYFQGDTVRDTRSGQLVEHRLDEAELRVLRSLTSARPPERPELAALRDKRLLFEEDGRVQSLVLSGPPAPAPWTAAELRSFGLPPYFVTR